MIHISWIWCMRMRWKESMGNMIKFPISEATQLSLPQPHVLNAHHVNEPLNRSAIQPPLTLSMTAFKKQLMSLMRHDVKLYLTWTSKRMKAIAEWHFSLLAKVKHTLQRKRERERERERKRERKKEREKNTPHRADCQLQRCPTFA